MAIFCGSIHGQMSYDPSVTSVEGDNLVWARRKRCWVRQDGRVAILSVVVAGSLG